jgi:hypothetical protein
MTSKLKKVIKKVDPLLGGDVLLDKAGLPSMFGDEFGFVQDPAKMATGSTVEAPANTPTPVDEGVLAARESQRKKQLAAGGMGGTNITGGLSGNANTQLKSLLGS